MILTELKIFQLFKLNYIRAFKGAVVKIAKTTHIKKSKIFVHKNARFSIGNHCVVKNAEIYVENGDFSLGDFSIIAGTSKEPVKIIINNGDLTIKDHSKISCKKIWIRFKGSLSIGSYTNINDGSEIRCDERIQIGSFNQISYNVKIWDTNTHTILNVNERRRITEKYFPYFGYEEHKPSTKPIVIGNDCWLGENTAILKGTQIGDGSIIGFGTILAGKTVPSHSRVISKPNIEIVNY